MGIGHKYSYVLSLLSLPPTHPSRSSQNTRLSSLCDTTTSHSLSILYINTYIRDLEKLYWWTYLLGRNRDTEVENGLVDTEGKGEGGTNWESGTEIYITMCKIASEKAQIFNGESFLNFELSHWHSILSNYYWLKTNLLHHKKPNKINFEKHRVLVYGQAVLLSFWEHLCISVECSRLRFILF